MDRGLLERIEAYYDAAPRSLATAEEHGRLTLFVNRRPGWHYYARPRLHAGGRITDADVDAVRARQRELGVPEAFEWVDETTPTLRFAAEGSGLSVQALPLMVLDLAAFDPSCPARDDVSLGIVAPDVPDLPQLRAAAELGFAHSGTDVGAIGPASLSQAAARLDAGMLGMVRERLRTGLTVMAAARDPAGPLAVGSHQPIGDVTEIVGVATLPAARRRGLASAVTRLLVVDAVQRGCSIVFLSADGEAVARIYARLGFRQVATAMIADRPPP